MSSNVSFALNLQSDSGQRAIIGRMESEIRLLENLKKFLINQVKAGKEYVLTLESISNGAMKNLISGVGNVSGDRGSSADLLESTSSIVTKVCLHIFEEVQSASQAVKENADFLSSNTLVKLNDLIAEKKTLLKMANDHFAKIKGRLDQFTELVGKSRAEYTKSFVAYESARTKFEDQCARGTPGKKGEDTREKFFRSKRKLNISHADYLMTIHEGSSFDKDFRTIFLPKLLEFEQSWCEKQISDWKEILDQVWNNSPFLHGTKLKDFEYNKEYLELISKHKCQPLQPANFKFEPADLSSFPASQRTLIVDSNTIEFLKSRLSEIEKKVKAKAALLEEKNEQKAKFKLGSLESEIKSIEVAQVKCELERKESLKNMIEGSINGKLSESTTQLETMSLCLSDMSSVRKLQKGNRIMNFFKSKTRLKKTVSFDGDLKCESVESIENQPGGSSGSEESLSNLEWFHGALPREDVVRLLKTDGEFLIRETLKNDERQIVLSVFWNGPKHFIVQTTADGQFRFEGDMFPTVKELIEYYLTKKLEITIRSGAILKKAVKKENWELNNDDVQLIEKIGRGNFGDVYKASLYGTLVAVKTCKVNLPEEQKKKFLLEARILKQFDHKNIVKFVGICVQKQATMMIVMELVSGGSLLTYLKNKGNNLTVRQMTRMCFDAASGMKYLEEKGCIHRDLAARNCLIDETICVKIGDFGMSREEEEYTVSDGMKQIPIKWTAPEALNFGKYTSLSDVWSYSILMWEIFSRGSTPYSGISNSKAREMIEDGYRMPAPQGIPDVTFQLMSRCWSQEPNERPRFSEIYLELETLLNSDLI